MTDLAFLGTGLMGLPMARNLLNEGFTVHAWNRTLERAKPLESDGAILYDDPREAAEGCPLLVTMLSDADTVLEVAEAALEANDGPDVWIQMSTIGLQGIERCRAMADERDITFVDAPVLGTKVPAEQGALVVLAAGPESARPAVEPAFSAVGAKTIWLGEAGLATRAKLAINSWVIGLVAVLSEVITAAEGLGVDPQVFFDAIEGGVLDLPYARMKGPAMIKRAFDDVSFRLALARKDADLLLTAVEEAGLDLPVMKAALQRMDRAIADGHGDEDMAATFWASAPR